MGKLAGRTLMHFSDGTTLTDKDVWPHQLTEEQFQDLTSVERVVQGWHLSILKSALVKSYFIITEVTQALKLTPKGGRSSPPAKMRGRTLGCYLEGSDPPVKLLLTMDPRTKNIFLEAIWCKNFRPNGLGAPLSKPKHVKLKKIVSRSMGDLGQFQWSITNEPPVRRVFGTQKGVGCLISVNGDTRAKVEIRRQGMNCHLLIVPE
jgi:hypothetical protein